MAYRALIILSLLAAMLPALADTAQEYFHRGAQFYVFGEKKQATEEVTTGLMLFPQDQDLQELAALMKKEEEQQQQQQEQQQKDQQDQQNQQSNPQQQQEQKQNGENQEQPQPKPQEQQQQQEANAQPSPEEKEQTREEIEAAEAAGQMTQEQAKRLLDAQKGHEMMLPIRPEQKGNPEQRPLKDW